jgi:DNA-binding response OmpR family regulator
MAIRVIVFGNKKTVEKLTASLDGKGFDLVCRAEVPEVVALLEQKGFDLVVVDASVGKAEAVCRAVSQLGHVTVALMVKKGQANWKELKSLDVDGYLLDGVGGAELAARLQAVARRRSSAKRIEKNEECTIDDVLISIDEGQ